MPQITTVELYYNYPGLPQWLSGKESSCKAGDAGGWGSIPGSGTSPGGGNGNSLQCPCLEEPRQDGEAAGLAKSQTQLKQLSMHAW